MSPGETREQPAVHDVAIIGAGVAGLTLARSLAQAGLQPVVLERARGVGGRCATRRIGGQAVDHGLAFLHGRSPRFLAELAVFGAGELAAATGWPRVREGDGNPCRPDAFGDREVRLAPADGVSRFAKHLARGLDVRLGADVVELQQVSLAGARGWELGLRSGPPVRSRAVALTLPVPSATGLLRRMAPVPTAVTAILPVLDLVHMVPCLTVIARYPAGTPAPEWEMSLPEAGIAIQAILNDSSKRRESSGLILVIQARPHYSRAHLEEPAESWTRILLEEAAALHGGWAARPESVQSHVWRNARVAPGAELMAPIALQLEEGGVLAVAGDGFAEAGGVQGAFESGLALAPRLLEWLVPSG